MNTNNNWLFDTISEYEQHHLDKSEKEFYDHLNIDRTVTFSGVSFDKDDHEKKFPIFIDSCIFKGERKISEFIILLLLRSSINVDWDYDVTLPLKTDNQDNEKMLHSWIVINDLIVCLYGTTIGRKLYNELIEWKKLGVEEVYISWYKNNNTFKTKNDLIELKNEALFLLQRGLLEIRSIANNSKNKPEKAQEALKRIYEISDACHNTPLLLDNSDLEMEIKMIKKTIGDKK